jgi:5-methyltetrahydrofolate--homocysteine methyltransferase
MLHEIREALFQGKKAQVEDLVAKALSSGMPAAVILNEGLIMGLEKVGVMFKNDEIFIPEVLVAARAMNAGMAILEPFLIKEKIEPRGTVVIGTVKGDLHDIGKNLVAMMLRGSGYKIIDLGTDVTAEKFVEAARIHNAGIIALSALLTTTMGQMKNVIECLRSSGLKTAVIIGGAPTNRDYANKITAEGYAPDAASAVDEVRRILAC